MMIWDGECRQTCTIGCKESEAQKDDDLEHMTLNFLTGGRKKNEFSTRQKT